MLGQNKVENADKCRSHVKRLIGYVSKLEVEKGTSELFNKIYASLKNVYDSLIEQKQSPFE